MIATVIGGSMIAGAVSVMAWENRPKQMKIRQSIRSVVVKKGIAHECYAEGRKIKVHPTVEYVIPKDYGYRALIHLPDRVTKEHFVARQEIFEHKIGHPIVFGIQGDILTMDIITTLCEASFLESPNPFQQENQREEQAWNENKLVRIDELRKNKSVMNMKRAKARE